MANAQRRCTRTPSATIRINIGCMSMQTSMAPPMVIGSSGAGAREGEYTGCGGEGLLMASNVAAL